MHIHRLLIISALGVLCQSAACERKKSVENVRTIPDRPVEASPIEVGRSGDKPLDLRVELRDNGIYLAITSIPAETSLTCSLSGNTIEPCHDGALIGLPPAGEYELNVVAAKNGATVSAASTRFTVLPTNAGGSASVTTLAKEPLALIIDDPDWYNGKAINRTQEHTFKFRFINPPACSPTVKCNYDSRSSSLWPLCDTPSSKTISKGLMASGLQYLTVQASCDGLVGPKLELYWYGVPANYEPLMLQTVKDTTGRHIFTLVRAEDCAESMVTWTCASDPSSEFKACEHGNVAESPKSGFSIRAACGDKLGPILTL